MRIKMIEQEAEKRAIKTCGAGEAFRWGAEWYTKIEINDHDISHFGDFYDEHRLTNMSEVGDYGQAVPVFHLSSQSFCYANGELIADEWANLTATLCAK
jgi:hypothetical protein